MSSNVDAKNSIFNAVSGNLYNIFNQVTAARHGTAEPNEPAVSPTSGEPVISIDDQSIWTDDRQIGVKATLFRDGTLASTVTTHSKNFLHGCRGDVLLIGRDDAGGTVWTITLEGKTAGGVGDPFWSSFQMHGVMNNVGAEEARRTRRMHVFYNFRTDKPFPEKLNRLLSGIDETFGILSRG